jgi:serine/threonine-protein kinase
MLNVILAFCIFGFCSGGGHWHHHHYHHHWRGHHAEVRLRGSGGSRREPSVYSDRHLFVPAGWKMQSSDPQSHETRFVSPDGQGSVTATSTEVNQQSISAHMRDVAFAGGEKVKLLRGGDDWIEVSGTKASRLFFKKAVLACRGQEWHQIDLEYPLALARGMKGFADRLSSALDQTRDDGCPPKPAAPTIAGSSPPQKSSNPGETIGEGRPRAANPDNK